MNKKSTNRLLPEKEFPPYKFVQGSGTPHPNKHGGYRFQLEEPKVEFNSYKDLLNNKSFLFALDLYNHKFYWEAHVWFESFWIISKPNKELSNFFKALILLCAASIKIELEYIDIADKQLKRAIVLLEDCYYDGKFISGIRDNISSLLSDKIHKELLINELKIKS